MDRHGRKIDVRHLTLWALLLPFLSSCQSTGVLGVPEVGGITELWISKPDADVNIRQPDPEDFVVIANRHFVQEVFRSLTAREQFKGSYLTEEGPRLLLFRRESGSVAAAFRWYFSGIPKQNLFTLINTRDAEVSSLWDRRFFVEMKGFQKVVLPYITVEEFHKLDFDWLFYDKVPAGVGTKRLPPQSTPREPIQKTRNLSTSTQ